MFLHSFSLLNSSCNLESLCCNFWISLFRWDSRVRVLLYFAPLQISLVLGITWSKFEFNIIKKGYRLLLFCQEQTITKKSQPNRSDSLISLDNSLPVAIKIALTFLVCMFCPWHEHHKRTTIIFKFQIPRKKRVEFTRLDTKNINMWKVSLLYQKHQVV